MPATARTSPDGKEPGLRPSYFNEIFDEAGTLRDPYGPLREVYRSLGEDELTQKDLARRAEAQGARGHLPRRRRDGRPGTPACPWTGCPASSPPTSGERCPTGLLQRGKAINAWLRAVYGAGQDLVPEEIVRGSLFYRPHDFPGSSPPVHVYGPDVVHLATGEYVVLEDNVRVPSGIAYSEAIRRAGMEMMPEVYDAYRIMEIYSYYDRLRETLELAAPEGVEEPERGRGYPRGRRPRVLRAPQDRGGVRHSADDARRLQRYPRGSSTRARAAGGWT